MTRRERVLETLNYSETYQVPKDLGGMASTGISCFAYPGLRKALRLTPLKPKVYDTMQMLALPDSDVLDALDCDVVTVELNKYTNAFDEPDKWKAYSFNKRINANVSDPAIFQIDPEGTISHNLGWEEGKKYYMTPNSYVFDEHSNDLKNNVIDGEIPQPDLKQLEKNLQKKQLSKEQVSNIESYLRKVRNSTDRAVFLNGLSLGLGFQTGIAEWSMLCLVSPDYVHEYHSLLLHYYFKNLEQLIPRIKGYFDILMLAADDHGTQSNTILPIEIFDALYLPYYQKANQLFHDLASESKTFMHCCGAVYPLIESIIQSGFDILNPVQWTAGDHSYKEWKDICRNRISLWGGAVDTQSVLPLGTVDEVYHQAYEIATYMKKDGGFVFNAIHNILAEINPKKIIALYQAGKDA